MDRQSNKHNPRVDDEMKKEDSSFLQGAPVDSRAAEDRAKEPEEGLPAEELKLRTDMARFIERVAFPGSREDILRSAQDMGAPEHVMAELKRLRSGSYGSFPQVWTALGHRMERQRS